MTARDVYQEFVLNHFTELNKDIMTEMELLFLINSNPKLQSLIKKYKERLFRLHWDEIQMLRITLINIKKEQICSHSNQLQTPK